MAHTRNESKDGVFTNCQIESPAIDEGISEGSTSSGVVLKKGPWTPTEDAILIEYVKKHGEGNWNAVQKHSGLSRCGKSCRLRWANHLRPNLKKGTFTEEEERLICEFHAMWGNKWARMAARLPGRTDNEIKNYWNTRIKRCQKTGLPLYPPGVQESHDCQQGQNAGGNVSGDTGHHDLLQANSFELPDIVFDSLKADQSVLQCVPELPNVSANCVAMRSLGYPQHFSFRLPTVHQPKRLKGPGGFYSDYIGSAGTELFPYGQFLDDSCENRAQPFYCSLPPLPDPYTKNSLSYSDIQGSQSLSTGNTSASKPTPVAAKLELPSLQYPETDISSWVGSSTSPPLLDSVDSFIKSPQIGTLEPESCSPCHSGLLDAVLYESKSRNSSKYNSSDKSTNSSTVTPGIGDSFAMNVESEMEDHSNPLSPLGNSATSFFNEHTPVSAAGSSLDEQFPAEAFTVFDVKTEPYGSGTACRENETGTQIDFAWPDSLLVIDWPEDLECFTEPTLTGDTVQTLADNDCNNDCKHFNASQPPGLGPCSCNNIPAVCQISELP